MERKFTSYLEDLRFDPQLWNSLQAKWITNIRLVILLILAVFSIGIISMVTLPRRVNPEVKIPIVSVVTILPGASPKDIESLVTRPLEDALLGMDKVDTITSISQDSMSMITMQFISTANGDKARDDAQSLVDTVTLPEDAQTPKVSTFDFENEPVWSFAISSKGDSASLMRFADRLKERIKDLSKVKNVDLSGLSTQEIAVTFDEGKMRDFNINPVLLSQTVKRLTSSYPAGTVDSASSAFTLTIDPNITTVADIRNIRISSDGQTVRLGDIATVVERSKIGQAGSFVSTRTYQAEQAVTFYVYKNSTANIDDTANEVEKVVNDTLKEYKGQFNMISIANAGKEIAKQYIDLLGEFRSTIILVFINLLLFLGLRQALLASFTIPLTFLSGLIFLKVFGLSINFISLFAFLLALGTSIDDTIVTVSSMTTYYRTGKFTPQETGLLVWRDFIVPIWSTTITTIWAYLPLLLTTGIIGEFIKAIPIVVTATMISSTLFAVTVTLPLMMVILKPQMPPRVVILMRVLGFLLALTLVVVLSPKNGMLPIIILTFILLFAVYIRMRRALFGLIRAKLGSNENAGGLWNGFKRIIDHGFINSAVLGSRYRRLITRILHSKHGRRNTLIAVVLFAIFSYMLVPFGFVKNEFFPKSDENSLYMNLELPPGTRVEKVKSEAVRIADEVRHMPTVTAVVIDVGREFGGQSFTANGSGALITILLQPKEERTISSIDTAQKLRDRYKHFAAGTVTLQEVSGGPPAGADIQIKLLGDDLTVLDRNAEKVMAYLRTQKGVSDISKSVKPGISKLVFVPDAVKMAEAGVTQDQLGLMLRSFASGFTLDKIKFENTEKEVNFRVSAEASTPEELGNVSIQTQNGSVPLLSLGELRLESNPTVITREEGKRALSVSATVQPGFVVADINKNLENYATTKLNLPTGYTWKTGGVNEENAKSVASIFQAMGLSFLLILLTMVIQFGSFRQAAIVLLLIPLAISGVFIVFALTATPLSFPALIGVLALFGIVVTNAMFIVDKINRNRKEGMTLNEAIADAAESRLEPIMLTSITTILGLIPVTLADPLWRGLGGAIIAGLSFSGIIMLLFVPVVYHLMFREKHDTA